MQIILDTNIIAADFRAIGHDFIQLRRTIALGQHMVHLPEVVLIEARALYLREVAALQDEGRHLFPKVERLVGTPIENNLEAALSEAENSVDDYVHNLVDALSARRLPEPNVQHIELVDRATRHRRPFREKGTGYRDALIWASVVELVREGHTVAFISNNSKDFADTEGNLHNDLKEDLKGSEGGGVLLFASLRRLFEYEPPWESTNILPEALPTPKRKVWQRPYERSELQLEFGDPIPSNEVFLLGPYDKVLEIADHVLAEAEQSLPEWLSHPGATAEAIGLPAGTQLVRVPRDVEFVVQSIWLGVPRERQGERIGATFEIEALTYLYAILPEPFLNMDEVGYDPDDFESSERRHEREVERGIYFDGQIAIEPGGASFEIYRIHASEAYSSSPRCALGGEYGWRFVESIQDANSEDATGLEGGYGDWI